MKLPNRATRWKFFARQRFARFCARGRAHSAKRTPPLKRGVNENATLADLALVLRMYIDSKA